MWQSWIKQLALFWTSELIINPIQSHTAQRIHPPQAPLQHMLSKHFQGLLLLCDCGQALTLICQYLQIPFRHPPTHPLTHPPTHPPTHSLTHSHFHLRRTEKVIFKRGLAFWHISDQLFRFKCIPRSDKPKERPQWTPAVQPEQFCSTA